MSLSHLTNTEVAQRLAQAIKAWRVSPRGAALSQVELSHKSGIGLTPLKRFEKTGATTLRNLVAVLRAQAYRVMERDAAACVRLLEEAELVGQIRLSFEREPELAKTVADVSDTLATLKRRGASAVRNARLTDDTRKSIREPYIDEGLELLRKRKLL